MKKIALLLCCLLLPTSYPLSAPLIQAQSGSITAVVILKKPITEGEIKQLLSKYPSVRLRTIYKHAIDGFTVSGSKADLLKLDKLYTIQTISEVQQYKVMIDESIPFIGGRQAWGGFDRNNKRLTGRGIKVGVIDTGIDYTHPDLKGQYVAGADLVDGDKDPMETRGSPDVATFHGTHVAGIIAANGKLKGVAPDAQIYAYRALGPGGSGNTEQVLAAIDAAIQDKVDVLNLSLGNNMNGPDLPISIALNRAVEMGIVAVTSNGNSGPNIWTVGSPGTSEKAISVGASTPPMKTPYIVYGLGNEKRESLLIPVQGAKQWDLNRTVKLHWGGLGRKSELRGVRGEVALIERGKLTFSEKIKNAKKAGAIAVIIYNNVQGPFRGGVNEAVDIPAATITKEDGEALRKGLAKRENKATFVFKDERDQLADFSSRGPVTVNWKIKPDVVAPGVDILSTVPSGYLSIAGTSMAAPHVAGACALLLQAHPNWTPDQVKSAIMSTAKPLKRKDGSIYHTYEQGAGRLQIAKALEADTIISPSSVSFGMFTVKKGIRTHQANIQVENTSDEQKRYSFQIPKAEAGIIWGLPQTFTLKSGERKNIILKLQINPNEMNKGVYDGYLTMFEGTRKISIPYLYVKEEPDYPRIMGFDFRKTSDGNLYEYEMYLPTGADEFGIAFYDIDSLRFIKQIDWGIPVKRGLIKKDIKEEELPPRGTYNAIIFAKKAGIENRIETIIKID